MCPSAVIDVLKVQLDCLTHPRIGVKMETFGVDNKQMVVSRDCGHGKTPQQCDHARADVE